MDEITKDQAQSNYQPHFEPIKQPVPNATAVLILGILSIVFCSCYGFFGIILGIVALVLAGQGKKAYDARPELYLESTYKNLNAGRICAIIGLSLSVLTVIFFVLIFALGIFAGTFSSLPGMGSSL